MMTVWRIVSEYLIGNGYDGLYNDEGECGCNIENIVECDEIKSNCNPGYQSKCDCGDHLYHIGSKKQ